MKKLVVSLLSLSILVIFTSCTDRTPEKAGVFWDSADKFVEIPKINIGKHCSNIQRSAVPVERTKIPRIAINHVEIKDPSTVQLGSNIVGHKYRFQPIAVDVVPDKKVQKLYWVIPKDQLSDGSYILSTVMPFGDVGRLWTNVKVYAFTIKPAGK